jgi:hypothetical protein
MTYVPNNQYIFYAAMAGAQAGMAASGRWPTDTNPASANNVSIAAVANNFAISYDELWGSQSADVFEIGLAQVLSEAAFDGRSPQDVAPFNVPGGFAKLAQALQAIVTAGENALSLDGITPPAAVGGRAYTFPGLAPAGLVISNPAGVFILGGIVTPAQSGLFQVSGHVNYSLSAAGATAVDMFAVTGTGLSFSNGIANGVGCEYPASDAGLTINGAGQVDINLLGGSDTVQAGPSGVTITIPTAVASQANGQPFPLGAPIIIVMTIGSTAGTNATILGLSLTVIELPATH